MGDRRSFPEPQVYEDGLLDVGQGNRIYWESRGNPEGRPLLIVHGGPGAGRPRGAGKGFDPDVFRIVLFDQRGPPFWTPSSSSPDLRISNTNAN